jgi:two-component sensor histidine kinase
MKVLVEEKDRLLEQKVLAEEPQHRVRNNLELVYGLSKQLDDTPDTAGRRGIKAISRRVSTLVQVYNHLLGNEMTRTTDFSGYVKSLCLNLAEIQATPDGSGTLTCDRARCGDGARHRRHGSGRPTAMTMPSLAAREVQSSCRCAAPMATPTSRP